MWRAIDRKDGSFGALHRDFGESNCGSGQQRTESWRVYHSAHSVLPSLFRERSTPEGETLVNLLGPLDQQDGALNLRQSFVRDVLAVQCCRSPSRRCSCEQLGRLTGNDAEVEFRRLLQDPCCKVVGAES
jgi:hypothetical protein